LEGVGIPLVRGKTWLPLGVALALLAASGGASATRLDKTACADLNTELSGLLASGLKEDMDKGPIWAAANLSPERLAIINRAIELQGVLEFRCGNPARNIAKPATKPDDKTPADKPGVSKAATAKPNAEDNDEAAPAKPQQKTKTLRRRRGSATNPDAPVVAPAATQPSPPPTAPAVTTAAKAAPETPTATKPAPELEKTATASPPMPSAPQAGKVTPVELNKAPAAPPVTASAQPKPSAAGAQKTAKKKPSRRDSTSAYVSPSDVNTYGLWTGR
jgi:hypothetical protein